MISRSRFSPDRIVVGFRQRSDFHPYILRHAALRAEFLDHLLLNTFQVSVHGSALHRFGGADIVRHCFQLVAREIAEQAAQWWCCAFKCRCQ